MSTLRFTSIYCIVILLGNLTIVPAQGTIDAEDYLEISAVTTTLRPPITSLKDSKESTHHRPN